MPMQSANQATRTHMRLGTITDNTCHYHILLQNIFVVVVIIVNELLVITILSISFVTSMNNQV